MALAFRESGFSYVSTWLRLIEATGTTHDGLLDPRIL